MRASITISTLALSLFVAPLGALAQTATSSSAPAAKEAPAAEKAEGKEADGSSQRPISEKRALPDYDGRGEEPLSLGKKMLVVPRVLLYPVHLTFEYLVRWPLGRVLTIAERDSWADAVMDFFTFNNRQAGVIPTFFLDFNFRPSLGVYFFWNNLFVENNDIRVNVGWGGEDWLKLTVVDRYRINDKTELSIGGEFWRRPDHIFSGVGDEFDVGNRSRYFREYEQGTFSVRHRPWRNSEIRFTGILTNNIFDNGDTDLGDISLSEGVVQGKFALPDAFKEGYFAIKARIDMAVDSRLNRPEPGSGIRLDFFWEFGSDLNDPGEREWLKVGGVAGAYFDLSSNRVLGLWAQAKVVNPLEDRPVPFTELVELGTQAMLLGGFQPGDLRGRSSFVATAEYRYPVWVFLDGSLHVSVGDVMGRNFDGFELESMRMSAGIGLRSIGDRDNSLNMLLAVGTSPFNDDNFGVESVRFLFGTQTGF